MLYMNGWQAMTDRPDLWMSSAPTHALLSQQSSVTKHKFRGVIVKNVKMGITSHVSMKPIQPVVPTGVKTSYIFRIRVM